MPKAARGPNLNLAIGTMLQFFRNFFGNKLGVFITLSFVAILGIAFALGSVSGTSFGGFGGGSRIATVGKEKISETDLDAQFTPLWAACASATRRFRSRNSLRTTASTRSCCMQWMAAR
ncbi:MAG: hypothetical protein ACKOOL_05205 [Novosphingobium sp.]